MSWRFNIPDVNFMNHFVYFKSLQDVDYNTVLGAQRKLDVFHQATSAFEAQMGKMNNAETKINEAIQFILSVAQTERAKELNVAKAYYNKIKNIFPDKDLNGLSEKDFIDNAEAAYKKLTDFINEAKLGVTKYITELKRIQKNIKSKTNLNDYMKDDFRYRLNSDISSMLKKMIGTYQENDRTDSTFSQHIQETVLEIIQKTAPKRIQNGEDFAAIATTILIDIEKRIQDEFDKTQDKKDLTEFTNDLEKIKDIYLKELERGDKEELTAAQQALRDINGDEYQRVIYNAKSILGLNSLDYNSEEFKQQEEKIRKQAAKRSKETQQERKAVSSIHSYMDKAMQQKLRKLTFKSLKGNTVHGDINELVVSLLQKNGIKAGKYAATDVISIECEWEVQPNDKFLNEILINLGQTFSDTIGNSKNIEANNRDLRHSIDKMSRAVDDTIRKIEEIGHKLNKENLDDFFIFHESLKLYSSIETGKSKKFDGRNMVILSYIDYMLAALEAAGLSSPLTRDMLVFLALNLSDNAVGQGNIGPLENYFSIFAGLLMFDDVANMAREAISQLPSQGVQQIHLYNLNGIYVPASLLLSQVGEALQKAGEEAKYAATATINYGEANSAINKWSTRTSTNKEHFGEPRLNPEDWQSMGAAVASGTTISISFMASFLEFIKNLGK